MIFGINTKLSLSPRPNQPRQRTQKTQSCYLPGYQLFTQVQTHASV